MAYNTKPIVTDKDGNPISQYYNPTTDQYEPVEGSHGANKVLVENNDLSLIPILDKLSQLTGTVIDEETRKSNELERIDNEDTRQSNENIRNTNEIARVEDEEIRIQNENTRIQNEDIRQTNEQDRVNLYNDLIDKVNSGYFDGKNLEFHWDGTKLGVRVEGETEYIYVDLKGDPGSDANVTKTNVLNALGYTPVNKAGDIMTGDLKVAGDIVAANKLAVGFNNVNAERFRFEYNGSSGRLELWANSSDSGTWVKKVEFPKRQDDNDFSLLLGSNQVWHEGNFDPSTKSNVNHNHNLANLSEKSYNSLTDKPNIPSKVSELENDANYVTQEELGDAGYGDMMKAIYDSNGNGIVDVAETVIGNEIQLGSYKLVYNSTANSLDIEVVA